MHTHPAKMGGVQTKMEWDHYLLGGVSQGVLIFGYCLFVLCCLLGICIGHISTDFSRFLDIDPFCSGWIRRGALREMGVDAALLLLSVAIALMWCTQVSIDS
jgi:hypothetical protein